MDFATLGLSLFTSDLPKTSNLKAPSFGQPRDFAPETKVKNRILERTALGPSPAGPRVGLDGLVSSVSGSRDGAVGARALHAGPTFDARERVGERGWAPSLGRARGVARGAGLGRGSLVQRFLTVFGSRAPSGSRAPLRAGPGRLRGGF